ncbi:MAG: ATPase [Alphaproteobacteria bacterium]|nr:ATPase [Alphaproteobacteria bacterium]
MHDHTGHSHATKVKSSCCHAPQPDGDDAHRHAHASITRDKILLLSVSITLIAYAVHLFAGSMTDGFIARFAAACFELLNVMWWGIAAGVFFVGLMGKVPREFVMGILGKGGSFNGILRACFGGLLLDLCSHGILLVGMKLYERGASLGQVMAFLIASPWNSISLTFILIALVGLPWTLTFIVLSALIAIASGLMFEWLVKRGTLPANPHQQELPEGFRFWREAKAGIRRTKWNAALFTSAIKEGFRDSAPILRWVFLGLVLAALIRSAVPTEHFAHYFGATLGGLVLTMLAATVIEVCSEGTTPIAADLLTRAASPGNAFAFLMAGVSTDYTEIMALKETTRSWKIALFLPLVTLPQIFVISWLVNTAAQ